MSENEPGHIAAKVIDPDGRTVVLTRTVWEHIMSEHPEMSSRQRAIMEAITHPDVREDDIRPGRERFYRQGGGPSRWLRVVVGFDEESNGSVVTAFGQRTNP